MMNQNCQYVRDKKYNRITNNKTEKSTDGKSKLDLNILICSPFIFDLYAPFCFLLSPLSSVVHTHGSAAHVNNMEMLLLMQRWLNSELTCAEQ